MATHRSEVGARFNHWTLIERVYGDTWIAECDCGARKRVNGANLKSGRSTQCRGCALRNARRSNPDSTNRMVVAGAIKRLPLLNDDQLERMLVAAMAERDAREFR